ncbi:MAG TPA: glycine--tRNA ligase [Flavobacteriaceae bacterium]|nr:glycine--tRNA ligase [Flavobacteriaceae bacterium]
MSQQEDLFKKVVAHAKEYGFIFASSEIYDGLSAVYDYGQNGSALKNNLRQYWWRSMVQLHQNIVGVDAAILMHPTTWKASGHVDAFNDPLIDNKDSKKRYRADVLIEDYAEKLEQKAQKEIAKAQKRFGESFDLAQFEATNERVLRYREQQKTILSRMAQSLENEDLADVKALIDELEIADPDTGSKNWTDVRQFNLMFGTKLGASADSAMDLYLRPETAQGIFVNYLNVQKSGRMKIPFGIAQTGKAFRNEIVARQFIFRMREFEQMEMQFFVRPGQEMQWYEYWKAHRMQWHKALGTGDDMLKFKDHENLAHYANAAVDIEFNFPFGFKELEGIHSRTDFDLKRHQEFSGKKLQFFDPELEKSYVPYVVETSIGLDRMFLAMMCLAYDEESVQDDTRTVLKLPPALAPVKVAVLPLVKKDGLPEQAMAIFNKLKYRFHCQYDEKDSIGKRYRRQDAIGTPFCITIDHQTAEDGKVTMRNRDTMEQDRVAIEQLEQLVADKVSMHDLLEKVEI